MKLIILGDTHFGVRDDSEVFATNTYDFYEKCMFPYMEEHGIHTVIQVGDFMDKRKHVNYRTLQYVRERFFGGLRKLNLPLPAVCHAFPGNHDIFYRNTNKINSLSELFADSEDNIVVHVEPTTLTFDGTDIDVIPWLNKYNTESTLEFMRNSNSAICFGHFEIAGFEMYSGVPGHGGLAREMFESYDHVYSGHYHHRSTKGNITYVGTPNEHTWSDFDDPKGFHVLDTDDLSMTFVENPHKMFYKVFFYSDIDVADIDFSTYTNKIVKVVVSDRDDNTKYESFITLLRNAKPADLSIVESDVIVLDGATEESIKELDTLNVLITSAKIVADSEGLDAKYMTKLIKDMYTEAEAIGRDA